MNIRETLESEGFNNIYEWTDEPDINYPPHKHKGKVSFYITKGEILMNLEGKEILIKEGERMDVPVGTLHSAKVGPDGCSFIVGEEIEGDS